MTASVLGEVGWGLTVDKEGHRDYDITWLIQTTDVDDGPAVVFFASGLPVIGSTWSFGNDSDPWAFCWPNWKVTKALDRDEEPGNHWHLTQIFSTKPLSRCQDDAIENPLSEPYQVSGSFRKEQKEAVRDKDGDLILSSSWERFPNMMYDEPFPTVNISYNVLGNPLALYAPMIETVNSAAMWGLSPRTIKLDNASFERRLYGTCTFYYNIAYEFSINYNTWDRYAIDGGTKHLMAGGDPDVPEDFELNRTRHDDEIVGWMPLDGSGNLLPFGSSPVYKLIQKHPESDFSLLGIPLTL